MAEERNWNSEIHAYAEENREAILADIARLVAIPSVKGESRPGAPFGEGPRAALDEALAMAQRLGLSAAELEKKIGWAELKGQQEEYLATITHLDVVPAGNGWDADPFTLRRQDGWLLGRGVEDDKGACVLCLYALAFFKQKKLPLRYGLRALMGCDEESGMGDVLVYMNSQKPPLFCFTPDAEFPVCNGEKGHYCAKLIGPEAGEILDFEGGVATNAIPDRAFARIRTAGKTLAEEPGITLEEDGEYVVVRGWGKSGHAAMPEGTVNAIGLIVEYLLKNGVGSMEEQAYLTFLHKLHSASNGSALGIEAADGRFDPLTVIGGTIGRQQGRLVQTLDCRYPTTTSGKTITEALRQAAGKAALIEMTDDAVPFYIEPDSGPIRALIDTYNTVTGQQQKPFTMGGGTYARHFPFAVSFGPEYPGEVLPAFGGPMHGANEAAREEGLMQALEIYIQALMRLEQLDFEQK